MISLRNLFGNLVLSTRTNADMEAEEEATTSQLLRLPPEIILLIANKLPTTSAACLALCSRRLKHILGPGYWTSLKREPPDVLLAFLTSIASDLPQHFACQECTRLHRMSAIKWPRSFTRPSDLGCTWRSQSFCHLFLSLYRIYFPQIQLAMKQHYHGTDIGFPLEAFQYLEVQDDQSQQTLTLLSVDAQIISDELFTRSQAWILLPWNQRDNFIHKLAEDSLLFDICLHTQIGPLHQNVVSDLVRSVLEKLEAEEKCSTETLQCPHCWMDYILDAIDFEERGFAVLVTKWVNLGGGLDFADPKWQSHITRRMARDVHRPHSRGEIRASFESRAKFSAKELTTDNKLKLFSRRKNQAVYHGSIGFVWKWDLRNSWYLAPSGPPEMSFWKFLTGSEAEDGFL